MYFVVCWYVVLVCIEFCVVKNVLVCKLWGNWDVVLLYEGDDF